MSPNRKSRAAFVESLEPRTFFSGTWDAQVETDPSPVASIALALAQRQVRSVKPSAYAKNVATDAFVSAEVTIPNGGIDSSTLIWTNVYPYQVSTKVVVPSVVNTSGGGDVIVLKPKVPLLANTQYRFVVTEKVKDVKGAAFLPFNSYFTTGAATHGSS